MAMLETDMKGKLVADSRDTLDLRRMALTDAGLCPKLFMM